MRLNFTDNNGRIPELKKGNSSGTPSKNGPKGGLVGLASAEQSTVEQGINNLAVSRLAGGDAAKPKSELSGGYLNCYQKRYPAFSKLFPSVVFFLILGIVHISR